MINKINKLALFGVIGALCTQVMAANVIKSADCYDLSYYEEHFDEATGKPFPPAKPILGVDLWNNKIIDYKKVMELRLKDDGLIDVVYTIQKEPYGTYSAYLMENTFLNYKIDENWLGQNVHYDWGKSILQLRDDNIDDIWDQQIIPMVGEYYEPYGNLMLERQEDNSGFVNFEIKDKKDANKTVRFSHFSTTYRPYIDEDGNLSRYAGGETYCKVDQLEALYQELKNREDFTILKAPKKVMSKEEVLEKVEGKLAKTIKCPPEQTTNGHPIVSEKQCGNIHNIIYSGLLRINAADILKGNPAIKELVNRDIVIGSAYDYEIYDEQTDTWTMTQGLENAIFVSPQTESYTIARELLDAIGVVLDPNAYGEVF